MLRSIETISFTASRRIEKGVLTVYFSLHLKEQTYALLPTRWIVSVKKGDKNMIKPKSWSKLSDARKDLEAKRLRVLKIIQNKSF